MVAFRNQKKLSICAMRDYFWDLVFQLLRRKVCREDFLVASICLLIFVVARPKETSTILHGPLWNYWGEGCVANERFVYVLSGERRDLLTSGRATCEINDRDNREFDSTKGYPGEDGLMLQHWTVWWWNLFTCCCRFVFYFCLLTAADLFLLLFVDAVFITVFTCRCRFYFCVYLPLPFLFPRLLAAAVFGFYVTCCCRFDLRVYSVWHRIGQNATNIDKNLRWNNDNLCW